jgi:uncharacterized protein HemX
MEDQQNNTQQTMMEEHHAKLGPVLGILLIVLVIILGGMYLWGASLDQQERYAEPRAIENDEPETARAEADVQILKTVSSSDTMDAIEADLESTNLDTLDAELGEMGRELERATD